jgi:hypothetical protein
VHIDASLPVLNLATEVLQVDNQLCHDTGDNTILKNELTTPMSMEATCQSKITAAESKITVAVGARMALMAETVKSLAAMPEDVTNTEALKKLATLHSEATTMKMLQIQKL